MNTDNLLYAAFGSGVVALLFAWWKTQWINRQDPGTARMQEIGAAVREGAMAFLRREYKVLAMVVVVAAALLAAINKGPVRLVSLAFVFGALCSGLSGYFGMRVATAANMRTTNAARKGLAEALQVAFSGGAVMGMSVVGLGLAGLTLTLLVLIKKFGAEVGVLQQTVLPIITGF